MALALLMFCWQTPPPSRGWSPSPSELGPDQCAEHSVGFDADFYFRSLETAERFLAAFPELVLADGVERRGF